MQNSRLQISKTGKSGLMPYQYDEIYGYMVKQYPDDALTEAKAAVAPTIRSLTFSIEQIVSLRTCPEDDWRRSMKEIGHTEPLWHVIFFLSSIQRISACRRRTRVRRILLQMHRG